jgi:hypothetical protein
VDVKERALASGARDFVEKPFEPTEVVARLRNLIETQRLHRRLRSFNTALAVSVAERTAEVVAAKLEVLERLARAGEYRDDMTGMHAKRVGRLSGMLARELRIDPERTAMIEQAAPLHDIGKIGVPDAILLKQGALTEEEVVTIRRHTTHHAGWNERHMQAMYTLQRTNLQSARAWRLKKGLREVYEAAAQSHSEEVARTGLQRWISWAQRSRLDPFKRLARTLRTHFEGVIAGMQQGRSNAFVEAMNGLLQNAKRAARGFRTSKNFIAIAYLRLSKLTHLPVNPFEHAAPRFAGITTHRC